MNMVIAQTITKPKNKCRYKTKGNTIGILQIGIKEEALSIFTPFLTNRVVNITACPRQYAGIVDPDDQVSPSLATSPMPHCSSTFLYAVGGALRNLCPTA